MTGFIDWRRARRTRNTTAPREELRQLRERVKELTLLHRVTGLMQQEDEIEALLQQFVRLVPPAWQFPAMAEARVAAAGFEAATPRFTVTPWIQRAEFPVHSDRPGVIEVVYLAAPPAGRDGPFLLEERQLMASLANLLAAAFERRHRADERRELAAAQASRQEAEAAARMKDALLASVSHELRRPLTAILGWTRMLRDGGTQDAARALAVIERSAQIQLRLIGELLDASRIGTGQLESIDATFSLVDLNRILESAVDAATPAATSRRIEIVRSLDARCPHVLGDDVRLQQIVGNVIGNAIKFTPAGGSVTVRLEHSDGLARIDIIDTGIGIDAAALPHIFQPFWQADAATSPSREGLGLGLAIAQRLVELHGGTIETSSEGPGRGTRMSIRLPLAPPASVSTPR